MSPLLGWRLVARDGRRSLLAAAGIGMAVLIVFVELGFLNGVIDSQLRVVAAARGELVVLDARRNHLNKWDELLPIRVAQIGAVDGVAAVRPVYQAGLSFRPAPREPEQRIIVMAFAPDDPPLELGWSAETLRQLRQPGVVLMDRLSRPIYGRLQVGQDVWIAGARMRLGGFIELGPTVITDGQLVMSETNFNGALGSAISRRPKMAVVQVAPGHDVATVQARLRHLLGAEASVFTKAELAEREAAYLKRVAPIGLLFGAGMLGGLFVGLVICYQVLYDAVRRRMKAFATLKAMGFGERFILVTVLEQAVALALAGYVLGAVGALWVYRLLGQATGLDISLTVPRAAFVATACVAACVLAGAMASARARRLPPAELF